MEMIRDSGHGQNDENMKWKILNSSKFTIQSSKFEELLRLLLANRGIEDKKDIEEFLLPDLHKVTPKNVGIDIKHLKKTILRIEQAIERKEEIIVYGDYDVDGITGAAILWEVLTELGAQVLPYIPHRVEEGYGLSVLGIKNLLLRGQAESRIKNLGLIITVDNGIVANEAVDFANERGIDVIITDHHAGHTEKERIPKAFSIVHTTQLCGGGVAYVLAKELLLHFKKIEKDDPLDRFLELATLATIADLVPLTAHNRTIVFHGLKKIASTTRLGLHAIFREAGCDITSVGVYEIGFIIAPRLNAAGRLESAMDSLRLLCTKNPTRAEDLANSLGRVNKQRQTIMFDASLHAIDLVKTTNSHEKKLLFVAHESYQEGIIGLIAGKLVEKFYRPAIVVSIGKEKSKGSVRSISGFNIIEFLRSHKEEFINVGGHPMAAGFSVKSDNVKKLKLLLEENADSILGEELLEKVLTIDMKLGLDAISPELFHAIQSLAPFGMKNPQPVFLSEQVEIEDMRLLGREGKHLRFIFRDQKSGTIIEGVGFGMGELVAKVHVGDVIDIAYTIDENTWNGNTKLQLKLKDVHSSNK